MGLFFVLMGFGGVYAEILPIGVSPKKLQKYKGVIISGGPARVIDLPGSYSLSAA